MLIKKNTRRQQIGDCYCPYYNISKVKKKNPVVSDLVKKTDYDAKISEIEGKYFTTLGYNKFTCNIIGAKIKQKELVNIFNIFNLVKNSDLSKKFATLETKAELKKDQDKSVKLAFDSSYFCNIFFLVMMVLRICLFINQYFIRQS